MIVQLAVLAVMLALLTMLSVPVLKKTLLAIAILEIPIQIDVYINHDDALAESVGTLSGFNLSITTVVLAGLYALWGAELAAGVRRLSGSALRAAVPTAIYVSLVVLSLTVAGDRLLALYEIVILAQAVLLFFYLLHHVRSREDLLFVVTLLMVGVIVQSLVVLGLRVVGEDVALGPVKADIDGGRINGTFGSPNVLGSYFALLLPVALGLMLTSARLAYRRLGAVAFGLGSTALILSFSRGAWVGFGLAIAAMLVIAWRRQWLVGTTPILIGTVSLVIVILFRDEVFARIGEYNNLAAQSRLPLIDFAVRMIGDAPLLGVGANNFAASLGEYVTVDNSRDWIFTVHNKYLLVWAETGLLALLAFVWTLVAALRRAWTVVASPDAFLAPLALGLVIGLLGSMIHMTVEIFHGRPQIQMLWLVIALMLTIPRLGDSSGETGTATDASRTPALRG